VIAYLDSSAIVKQYLRDETGSTELESIVHEATGRATSRLSYVEVRAALAAAVRASRIVPMEYDRSVAAFESDWPSYAVVEFSDAVGRRAGSIAEAFRLRTGDAIQLASILELDPDDSVLVAWDSRLRLAARAAGLATLPLDA
jgi:predicted nucleic acid-binding protein